MTEPCDSHFTPIDSSHDMEPHGKTEYASSAQYFHDVAETYATRYSAPTPAGYTLRVRQQRVLEMLETSCGKVLDVGCGPGVLCRELRHRGYKVWGVDPAPGMIDQCLNSMGSDSESRFTVGSANSLPYSDGFFDCVTCIGVLAPKQAYPSALKEMTRVLKEGGILIVSFPNHLSPYVVWKSYIFYPLVALLRPLFYRVVGRSLPPSLYSGSPVAVMPSFKHLHTARAVKRMMANQNTEVTDIVYFNYNVFLPPLDEIFPRWTLKILTNLEGLRFGKLKWLGTGYLIRTRKQ